MGELKIFATLIFSVKTSQLSFKANFVSPNECLLEKYGLQLYENSFESRNKSLNYQNAPA